LASPIAYAGATHWSRYVCGNATAACTRAFTAWTERRPWTDGSRKLANSPLGGNGFAPEVENAQNFGCSNAAVIRSNVVEKHVLELRKQVIVLLQQVSGTLPVTYHGAARARLDNSPTGLSVWVGALKPLAVPACSEINAGQPLKPPCQKPRPRCSSASSPPTSRTPVTGSAAARRGKKRVRQQVKYWVLNISISISPRSRRLCLVRL